jgi:hypothetical protein
MSKNIKHAWSVLTQASVIDQQTNNISMQNIVEQLQVNVSEKSSAAFKLEHPEVGNVLPINFPMQVISLWRSINPNVIPGGDVEIGVFDTIGDLVQKIEFKLQFEAGKGRMRTIISIPTVNITDTGLYLFKVKIKEDGEDDFTEVAEIPFEVVVTKEA